MARPLILLGFLTLAACGNADLGRMGEGMAAGGAAMQGGYGYSPPHVYLLPNQRPMTCYTVGPQTVCR